MKETTVEQRSCLAAELDRIITAADKRDTVHGFRSRAAILYERLRESGGVPYSLSQRYELRFGQ